MNLGDAMRIEGLRKENERLWAVNERLRKLLLSCREAMEAQRTSMDWSHMIKAINATLGTEQTPKGK